MTNPKIKLLAVLILTNLLMFIPLISQAINVGDIISDLDKTAQNARIITEPQTAPNIYQITGNIINISLSGLGIIFLLLMIFGGIRWMTAGGNEENVKKASSLIYQATIGLIIVISAFLLTNFVIFQVIETTTPAPVECTNGKVCVVNAAACASGQTVSPSNCPSSAPVCCIQ